MADAPLSDAAARRAERVERARLTTRRLLGLDRSGPPPPETLSGHPLRPWTIPNAIGFVRLALIPVFLVIAYDTRDGQTALGAAIFLVIAVSDYLDGMAARITGQYSRLGALLDPLVDRLVIVAGLAVCWSYELLPRWAIAILVAREVLMLALARIAIQREVEIQINWWGRMGVWFSMAAPFWAIVGVGVLAKLALYIGLALSLTATVFYIRSGWGQLRGRERDCKPGSRPSTPT